VRAVSVVGVCNLFTQNYKNMKIFKSVTAAEAGISGDEQVRIALRKIIASNGVAQMQQSRRLGLVTSTQPFLMT